MPKPPERRTCCPTADWPKRTSVRCPARKPPTASIGRQAAFVAANRPAALHALRARRTGRGPRAHGSNTCRVSNSARVARRIAFSAPVIAAPELCRRRRRTWKRRRPGRAQGLEDELEVAPAQGRLARRIRGAHGVELLEEQAH